MFNEYFAIAAERTLQPLHSHRRDMTKNTSYNNFLSMCIHLNSVIKYIYKKLPEEPEPKLTFFFTHVSRSFITTEMKNGLFQGILFFKNNF